MDKINFDRVTQADIDYANGLVSESARFPQVCAYACPEAPYSDVPSTWQPKTFTNVPKTEKKTVDIYKEKFANLFMEMEQELGWCKIVHIEHADEWKDEEGKIMSARVDVKIEF